MTRLQIRLHLWLPKSYKLRKNKRSEKFVKIQLACNAVTKKKINDIVTSYWYEYHGTSVVQTLWKVNRVHPIYTTSVHVYNRKGRLDIFWFLKSYILAHWGTFSSFLFYIDFEKKCLTSWRRKMNFIAILYFKDFNTWDGT